MDVRLSNNSVIRAMREKATAEQRAIICYPFRDGEGRLSVTYAGRCAVTPSGQVYRMSEIVLTVHGTAAIVGMAPNRQFGGGVKFKLRLDKTGEVVDRDYRQLRPLDGAS
jgi:hypothetical protein